MKNYQKPFATLAICLLLSATSLAQTSSFTYQGKLTDGGVAANGQYDLTFKLYNLASGGTQIGLDVVLDDVQVIAGVFTAILDFGSSPFTSETGKYLEIAVRPGASTGTFTMLSPRQPITSSPFSIKTLRASSADSLSAACVGCVSDANIAEVDGGKVTGSVASAATAVDVTGVVQIANGGTGSATKDFVDLSTNQDIDGKKTFIFPISGSGSQLTNLNGANLGNGSVTTPKLADGSVTQPKLAYGAANKYDLQLLGMLRWDLLPTPPAS